MDRHFIFEDEEAGYFAVCAPDVEEAFNIACFNFGEPILVGEATDEQVEIWGLDEF